jgi:NifU-like protein involved in Fe-S cluster formation
MFSINQIMQRNSKSLFTRLYTVNSNLYHSKVIDHYENPRNVGALDKKLKNVGTGLVGAPACGDVMKLQIEVDDNGVISNAVFKVSLAF